MKQYLFIVILFLNISIFLILTISCNNENSNCLVTATSLYKTSSSKLFVVDKFDKILRDKCIDSIKGGEYSFYKNEQLKSYRFFQNMDAYTYNEEYDSTGKISKIEGKLLVYSKVREVNRDSAFFRLYLFSLNKLYTNSLISINNISKLSINPSSDTLYSNMSVISFGINTKGLNDFNIYLETDYIDLCNSKREVFRDTLHMTTTPVLNFINL